MKSFVLKPGVIPLIVPVIVILFSSVIIVSKAKDYFQSAATEGVPSIDLAADSDSDGFADHAEENIGTDAKNACGNNAWPPDFNSDGVVNVQDINAVVQKVGTEYPTPGYNRYDLDLNGKVQEADVKIVQSYYFKNCSQASSTSVQTATGGGTTQTGTGSTQASPITSVDLKADTDKDGFADHVEANIGTDAKNACGNNAWPPDFNSDGVVNVQDINAISQKGGMEYPTPGYNRYDLDLNGKVTGEDVKIVQSYYLKTCNDVVTDTVDKQSQTSGTSIWGDKDKDGFAYHLEANIGTDPDKACGVNAWPPDFNNDGKVTIGDLNTIRSKIGTEYPTPGYSRYDFNLDGKVTEIDAAVVQSYYFVICSDTGVIRPTPQPQSGAPAAENPAVTIAELLKKNTLAPRPKPTPVPRAAVDVSKDTDKDQFKDHVELNVGTDPNRACGENSWPPDFNSDGKVTVADLNMIAIKLGTEYPAPDYNRYDFDLDGRVSQADLNTVKSFYSKTCTRPVFDLNVYNYLKRVLDKPAFTRFLRSLGFR